MIQEIYSVYDSMGKTRATPHEIVDEIEAECGVEFIGRGANRAVFKDGEYVYKVPISSTGSKQNSDSNELYNQLKSRGDDDVVADVERFYEGILKQKYCPLSESASDRREIEDKLEAYGYNYLDWDESSVGFDGNFAVLIDIAGLKL